MLLFWAVAGVLAAAAAGLILARAGKAAVRGDAADPTPELYRRQLAEIDDLAEQGLLRADEQRSARAEAARRFLAADAGADIAWSPRPEARRSVLAAAILVPALALGLYLATGAPGVPDQPFAARLARWSAQPPMTLTPPQMAAVLQAILRERPDDVEGWRFLAVAQGAAANPAEAVRALRRAVRLAPERADLRAMLGEAQIMQAGGEVTAEARASLRAALERDPKAETPRFYLAKARIADGDVAGGVADWRALLADLPADDPRRPALTAAIGEASRMGARPAVAPGQAPMIQAMVQGLAQRLKARPEDPEGWVRLVRAYAVLGDVEKRDAALMSARTRYAARPEIVRELEAAAKAEPMR